MPLIKTKESVSVLFLNADFGATWYRLAALMGSLRVAYVQVRDDNRREVYVYDADDITVARLIRTSGHALVGHIVPASAVEAARELGRRAA